MRGRRAGPALECLFPLFISFYFYFFCRYFFWRRFREVGGWGGCWYLFVLEAAK